MADNFNKIIDMDMTLKQRQLDILNVPRPQFQPHLDLRLSSTEFAKQGNQSLVPVLQKPKENTVVQYRPYSEHIEFIKNTLNEMKKYRRFQDEEDVQTIIKTIPPPLGLPPNSPPNLQTIPSGSSAGYNPLPSGNMYKERTTNSTTYPTDVKKHYINIDTKFRNNPDLTTTTNFRWRMYRPIKNCISLRVASIEIPNNFYIFSASKGNTTFQVKLTASPSYTTLTIPDGNYTAVTLEDELTTLLQTIDANFTVEISFTTGKLTIKNLVNNFDINFTTDPSNIVYPFGLGVLLGFTASTYTNKSTLTGERFVNLVGDNYIFLQVGDYDGIEHSREKQGVIVATAKIIVNVDKFSVIFDNGSNFLSKEVLFPMPTNIASFTVRLIDSNNKDIDLLGTDFSFTLELVELVNSTLYSGYSDNLLQNNDTPR